MKSFTVQQSRELMEYLVNQALLEWQIYNMNPSTDNFMAEKDIENAIQYIMKKIAIELTPTSRTVLSIGYPMETQEEILESIKNKAKMIVLNYAIKQNEDMEANQEPLKNINAF